MKIKEVLAEQRRSHLSPLKKKVLDYLEGHSDEVFRHGDGDLARALGESQSAVDWTLWWLEKNSYIGKERFGRVFFGSKVAIDELRRQREAVGVGERRNGRGVRRQR